MSDITQSPTTISNIGVVMFTVADQDAALALYTKKLGFEVRSDASFGEHGEMRWLEVAPPGSRARLALNPPMYDKPGGSSIGVETPDVLGEHARLSAIGGIDQLRRAQVQGGQTGDGERRGHGAMSRSGGHSSSR